MKTVALFLFLTGLLGGSRGWRNEYGNTLEYKCPAGQSISSINSENSIEHGDRRWEFSCQATFGQSAKCFWTTYINYYNQQLLFECPANYEIAGMGSYYDSYYKDRRWAFYCCRNPCVTTDCHWTSYVNYFNEYIHWTVPSSNVLVAAQSYHQNHQEDRRWRYKVCPVQMFRRCSGGRVRRAGTIPIVKKIK